MYKREVCEPLGLDLHVKFTGSSLTDFMSSDSDQLGSDPEESGPDETLNDESIMVDDRIQVEGLEFVWGRIHLTGNRVEGIHSELVRFAEDLPIYQSEDEAFKDELYKLIGNLPLATVGTPYDIVSSITLSAQSFNRTRPQGKTPRVLKPINLIQLRPKLVQWCKSIHDPVVYRRFIAAGFDLLHNCIAVRVTEDLRMDTLQVEEGAYDAARLSHLRLREATLHKPEKTFARLHKYIKRAYRWPH
jgi:hypothetical protein